MSDKISEWINMDDEQRRKYNGYSGFVKGERFSDSNMFLKLHENKLARRKL